jgi:hypothetical protein
LFGTAESSRGDILKLPVSAKLDIDPDSTQIRNCAGYYHPAMAQGDRDRGRFLIAIEPRLPIDVMLEMQRWSVHAFAHNQ